MSIFDFLKDIFANKQTKADIDLNTHLDNAKQVLQDYAAGRYTPLDIDLSKIDLSGTKNKSHEVQVLPKNVLKRSKIPIYTGNPFNPYF